MSVSWALEGERERVQWTSKGFWQGPIVYKFRVTDGRLFSWSSTLPALTSSLLHFVLYLIFCDYLIVRFTEILTVRMTTYNHITHCIFDMDGLLLGEFGFFFLLFALFFFVNISRWIRVLSVARCVFWCEKCAVIRMVLNSIWTVQRFTEFLSKK